MTADSLRAADAAARRAAQTCFDRPLAIEAGAGTGKTSVLVARLVAWCLGPGWEGSQAALGGVNPAGDGERVAIRVLDRVVAITFTEAAAAELEARVGEFLRALAREEPGDAWPRGLEPDAVSCGPVERCGRARALLQAFDRLRVSTIHAFCRRLLAEHPLEADLHPRFTVDASGAARAAAAREVVEAWLVASGSREDPALVELLASDVAAPELEAMLIALLAAALPAVSFSADPLAKARVRALVARLLAAARRFVEAEGGCLAGLGRNPTARQVGVAARRTRALLEFAAADDAQGLGALLREVESLWPPTALERLQRFGRGQLGETERAAAAERSAEIEAAAAPFESLLRHALSLEPPLLARAHRVLAPLLAQAEAKLRRQGVESFDGLLQRTRDLLERHPAVAERVGGGIDQLLVDEFQDTDAAQCAIVARLALGATSGSGGRPGLFVVGDPKQSIYGWRNADLAAYQAFLAEVERAGGRVDALSVNHRSKPALLDEVSRVIGSVMCAEPGLQPPFAPLVPDPGASRSAHGPAVEYWISADWDAAQGPARTSSRAASEREADRLAKDLLRLARKGGATWRWEEVGILLRTGSDSDLILEALRAADIPYAVARDRSYVRRREVIEASALARCILDLSDQIAQVATLRAAWVGVPDAAWRPLWERGFPAAFRGALEGRDADRSRLRRIAGEAAGAVRGLPIPGLERLGAWEHSLAHAVDVLAALRRSFERDPAERFVEKLRALPLLDASEGSRFLGAWRLANLDRFFRELGASLAEHGGDPAPVLRALRRDALQAPDWDEGRAQHPSEDAVQVMTIHAAKGLEFEHVYVLQLHKGAGTDSEPLVAGGGEWRLAVGPPLATLGFDELETRRRKVADAERVRLLYVAMTRAKRRLVLAGSWGGGAPKGDALLALLETGRGPEREAAVERARSEALATVDDGAVRFRFLGSEPDADVPSAPRGAPAAVDLARVREDSDRLRAERPRARARSERPLGGAASEKRAADLREPEVGADGEPERWRGARDGSSEVATAAGSAVHAFLQHFEWEAGDPAEAVSRERRHLAERFPHGLSAANRRAAHERAERILDRLISGPLWARLRAIAPRIVAREIPLLLSPDESARGPVGYAAGAIDLVYRDAESGAPVVVDFKTDRIEGDEVPDGIVERHRAQARSYQRAVQEALSLERPPRFELWFLDAGCIVDPDAKRGGGSGFDARGD
jgi:ATP-dependent helicase/nuclease subunit A